MPDAIALAIELGILALTLGALAQVGRLVKVLPVLLALALAEAFRVDALHPAWVLESLVYDVPWLPTLLVVAVQLAVLAAAPVLLRVPALRVLWLALASPLAAGRVGPQLARQVPGGAERAGLVLLAAGVTTLLPVLSPTAGLTGFVGDAAAALGVLAIGGVAWAVGRRSSPREATMPPEPNRTARPSAAFEQATLFASGDGGGRDGAAGRPGADDNGASDAEKRRDDAGARARIGEPGWSWRGVTIPVIVSGVVIALAAWMFILGGVLEFAGAGLEQAPVYIPRVTAPVVGLVGALVGALTGPMAGVLVHETELRALALKGDELRMALRVGIAVGGALPMLLASRSSLKVGLPFWLLQVVWVVGCLFSS